MKILVYGWYNNSNIGDNLFSDAFINLFPAYQFAFHETIKLEDLQDVDAVFFGGGSFLLGAPAISGEALDKIKKMPIFYLGIGVEADIHPIHMALISLAKMIATRSPDQIERLKMLNPNVMWIPDLVYALQSKVERFPKEGRSVLVMPNLAVVPNHLDPYWKHASWAHFKSEFAQFLDVLREEGYKTEFLSMCRAPKENDDWAASEIISHMTHRGKLLLDDQPVGIEQVSRLISKYNVIITQRFHGIILSEMTKTPYIAISHHDKIKNAKPCNGLGISYYNVSKQTLLDTFYSANKMIFSNSLPIEPNTFKTFSQKIIELVENGAICWNQTK